MAISSQPGNATARQLRRWLERARVPEALVATTLAAAIDGTVVARTLNAACRSGLAGVMSNWTSVQFADLTVR